MTRDCRVRVLSARLWWAVRVDERGSISAWMAVSSVAMIIMAGLAVDLGGQVYARERVVDVAAQAARAAGQQLQEARAVQGDGVRTDPARAVAAARSYLAASDVSGTVTLRGGNTVMVSTTATYNTKFLGIIGIDHLTVTGSSQSRSVRAVHGTER